MKVWERFLKNFSRGGEPPRAKDERALARSVSAEFGQARLRQVRSPRQKVLAFSVRIFLFPARTAASGFRGGRGKRKSTRSRAMIQIPVCRKNEFVCMKADRRKNGCQAVLQGVIARKDRKVLTRQSVLIHKTCSHSLLSSFIEGTRIAASQAARPALRNDT